jgi:ribosomal protein L14E/L6E/L27E
MNSKPAEKEEEDTSTDSSIVPLAQYVSTGDNVLNRSRESTSDTVEPINITTVVPEIDDKTVTCVVMGHLKTLEDQPLVSSNIVPWCGTSRPVQPIMNSKQAMKEEEDTSTDSAIVPLAQSVSTGDSVLNRSRESTSDTVEPINITTVVPEIDDKTVTCVSKKKMKQTRRRVSKHSNESENTEVMSSDSSAIIPAGDKVMDQSCGSASDTEDPTSITTDIEDKTATWVSKKKTKTETS